MKNGIVKIYLLVVFAISLFSSVAYAENEAKVIYYVTENKENVEVKVTLSGKVDKLLGFTVYTGYDKYKLKFNQNSFKLGELMERWLIPNTPVVNNTDTKQAYIYFTGSAVLDENLFYSLGDGEEKMIASFSFDKVNDETIQEDSVCQTGVFSKGQTVYTIINTENDGDIRFDTMPERFVTIFTPYMEGENTVSVEKVELVDKQGYAIAKKRYMLKDDSVQLYAEVSPTYAADKTVKWSAEGVVDVNEQGLVTAKNAGEGTITAIGKNGIKSNSISVVVQEKEVVPEVISINNGKKDMSVNELYQFIAEIKPDNTTNQQVVWSVSNTNATVNPRTGLLKALKVGDTIVRATSVKDSELVAEYIVSIHEAAPIGIEAAAISVMVPEMLNVNTNNWSMNSYKIGFNVFNANAMPVLKEDSLGAGWSKFYNVEYSDNFADKGAKGITREEDVITVSPEAQDIQGLQVTAKLKNKVDGQVVLTALSNIFDVKGKIQITDIMIEGTEIIERSGDGTYKTVFAVKKPVQGLSLKAITNGTVYYSYQINNGQIRKSDSELSIDSSMVNQGDNITIYIYSDNRPGAAGYSYNAFIDQVSVHIS